MALSIYSKPYIPVLLTVCNNVGTKNVIKLVKLVNLLNVKLLNQVHLSLTVVGNLISFNISWLATVCWNDWLTLTFNCFFAIHSGNYSFQLTNHLIWLTYVTMFLTERKKQIRNKIDETTFADIDLLYFSALFPKKSRFHWRRQTFRKRWYSLGRIKPFWYRRHWIYLDLCSSMRNVGISK